MIYTYERVKIFEVKEIDSALRNFARVYTIDGKLRLDPQSFLDGARENMIRVLRDNRNTKVKLILKCYLDFPNTNEIKPANFYKDISGDVKDKFDTSDYPPYHPSGIPTGCNKKVLGMFKDEAGGKIIDEFVGLRAKLYSYKMFEGKESKKCKGVKKSVVKESIRHEDYKNCLFTGKQQLRKMNVIRSHKHDIYTEEVNKIALSPDYDKRHILEGQTDTLALGNYRI